MDENKKSLVKEITQYALIIVLVVLIRVFIFTPIKVEQHSMYPTLNPKDVMILNKITLRVNEINRFDIVVAKLNKEHIIKRVIGLPGEHIEFKDNKLFVNNEYVEDFDLNTYTDDFKLEDINEYEIPENQYFLLGDNRENSTDSRIFGLIEKKDILGKANLVLFPFKNFGIVK